MAEPIDWKNELFNQMLLEIYIERAYEYISKGNFDLAIDDFKKATALQPDCVSSFTPCYIISRAQSDEASRYLLKLHATTDKIRNMLIYKPDPGDAVAHYTQLDTLKKLIKGDPLRLYNASYMNDPEEGEIFLNIIKSHVIEKNEKELADNEKALNELYPQPQTNKSLSPAYIGSFIQTREAEEKQNGKLFLWRTYGKDSGMEAAGACLHFDISQFSHTPSSRPGAMVTLAKDSTHLQENCIYKVIYERQCQSDEELKTNLRELAETLKNIVAKCPGEANFQMAREILDEIRFLFKANHYQEEKELRIVEVHYSSEDSQAKNITKVDVNLSPPRFYMEAPQKLQLREVVLGPQTQRFQEWKWWIEKKNKSLKGHVRQSKTKYRSD